MRSRVTLASTDAAATDAQASSPFMTVFTYGAAPVGHGDVQEIAVLDPVNRRIRRRADVQAW